MESVEKGKKKKNDNNSLYIKREEQRGEEGNSKLKSRGSQDENAGHGRNASLCKQNHNINTLKNKIVKRGRMRDFSRETSIL